MKITDIKSKNSLTTETHSITIFDIDNKPTVTIKNDSVSIPYKKDMLISNIYVDENTRSFETPRKKYSVTAPGARILLGYDYAQSFEIPQKTITASLKQVPSFG